VHTQGRARGVGLLFVHGISYQLWEETMGAPCWMPRLGGTLCKSKEKEREFQAGGARVPRELRERAGEFRSMSMTEGTVPYSTWGLINAPLLKDRVLGWPLPTVLGALFEFEGTPYVKGLVI